MPDRGVGNTVPAAEVRSMFDRIAPVYDAMNTVMTLGLDGRWRRAAVRAARLRAGMTALDVACGTGVLTRELARTVGPEGTAIGVDSSPGMLERARRRSIPGARFQLADALDLPLADRSVDAATIAFGLRNVADYRLCLAEMARVTKPGGRVVVLELAAPTRGVGRLVAATWLRRVVPILGGLLGRGRAYRYLPASVESYPSPGEVAALMAGVGLRDVRWRRLAPGLVTLHAGIRA